MAEIDRTRFHPYRGTEANIHNIPITDGYLYFAADTGRIYMDYQGERHAMGGVGGGGGGNICLWYSNQGEVDPINEEEENEALWQYILERSALEDTTAAVTANDLIINSDGAFYKVLGFTQSNDFICSRIAISGTGGGGGGQQVIQDLFLEYNNIDLLGATYIYGQSNVVTFVPSSTADSFVSMVITAKDLTGANADVVRQVRLYNGDQYEFNTNLLPKSSNIEITVLINSPSSKYNKGKGLTMSFSPISVLDMYLEKPSDVTLGIQNTDASLPYIPYFEGLGGEGARVSINYSIDGSDVLGSTQLVSANSKFKQYIDIPAQPHGMHTVDLWLSVNINDQDYLSSPITYEVPWVEAGNEAPIIWMRNELGTITNYEPAVVEYMIYDAVAEANGAESEISLYRGSELLNVEEVHYDSSTWWHMDLTPYYEFTEDGLLTNNFTLTCGNAVKNVSFVISDIGARDLSVKYANRLKMNFDSLGRSNKEIRSNRVKWVSKTDNGYEATLRGFNWYSNGWQNDNDGNGSYLAVANGASVEFPLILDGAESAMTMNTNSKPWSFEMRFRIRNAKKFATLVTEIPKYRYTITRGEGASAVVTESEMGQEKTLDEIAQIPGAAVMLDEDGNMVMNEANTTKKIVQTEKYVAMKFLNGSSEGFAIGTQEAYFNTSGSTVNVKYKENEIINITFVVDRAKDQLSIYLNGILSGVGGLASIPAITMDNECRIVINSEYCDFDLFRFRVYPVALTMPDVIHNYIADIKDVNIYDENQLTDVNDATALDYHALVAYNEAHPDDPTMPYAVIDMTKTSQGTDLPHYKGAKRSVRIEFTNPVADYLLESGQITPYEYYTHCPSYEADNAELNVQGTSSQKYPRRNFKAAFKKSKETWKYTKGPLAGTAIQDGATLTTGEKITKKWHMDSELLGVNKFTWKIDYMESSGSYNTGFANLMGSGIYNKHPLEDLHLDGVDTSIYRTSVYGFPMLVFHKTGPDTYTYIGRYNMNLDKGANERYGFEEKYEHPFVTAERPILDENDEPVIDPNTNEPVVETYHPSIAEVSECWELRDNQGTWCSWRYPTQEMRAMGFNARMAGSNESDPKIEVANHFEARYHAYADQFEYAQNIILGKNNEDDFSADIGGATNSAASAYVYNKLSNLERLFNWLDSTDTSEQNITNITFDEPRRLLVNGKLTKKISNPAFIPGLKPNNPAYQPEYIYIEDTEAMETNGVTYEVVSEGGVNKTYGIFTKDSKEYRRQKFYAEFEDHLDLHYCCVYFVMTELLLCYDSRGKNMMIATFGPRKSGGEYIWYPIFYDIDTQLGLNNVGAKLWDYDEDCSENGTFSTKDSVLWTNLYDVYRSQIESTYRQLRNGKIDEATIENSYRCRAGTTFNSYAMMGKRPIIAIGLDEYYKYVMPVTVPWKDQTGNMVTANYLYACQGDRILSQELLVENRILYMDSKWLGGNFTINTGGMSGIMFRSTGNKPSTSSDIYREGQRWDNALSAYVADENIHYPVPYYDAIPEYYVTPYLNFYVTTFVDENTFQTPEAYKESKYPNGIPTVVSDSVVEGYRSGDVDQQLNYFAGSEYLSSLGDLSLKYVNQVNMPNCPRLLDISLGNDAPGYFNAETLDPFDLCVAIDQSTGRAKAGHEKSLLDKINLTNVYGVKTNLDLRAADKLREFRALGTSLTYALFADGAPLTTVHLPPSVTRILFTQNKNLTKLITTTKPNVINQTTWENSHVLEYNPRDYYEGLFIDGITNFDPINAGTGSLITEVSFEGDALGYGSYTILKNIVSLKNGTGREQRLKIRMIDVSWTPYVQVEYGEAKLAAETYYYLTEHSTYELYDRSDDYWAEDTLNGRIYTYDNTKDESIITDDSLFKIFLNDYDLTPNNSINQFTNNIESMAGQKSYPTISGEVFISNASGEAIEESDLTTIYAAAWPNLKIRVANVNPAYIARYVQRLDSGKDNEVDIIRYARDGEVHPTMTAKVPTKANYDFEGWTLDPQYAIVLKTDVDALKSQGSILDENAISNLMFDAGNDVYTFYAVFSIMTYKISFLDPYDNHEITSYYADFGTKLHNPDVLPTTAKPDIAFDEVYNFLGWVATAEEGFPRNSNVAKLIDLTKITSQYVERTYYAAFVKGSVYDNPTPEKYFRMTNAGVTAYTDVYDESYNLDRGCVIMPIAENALNGKVTIPNTFNGVPVVGITGFNSQSNLTHVFFYDEGTNMRFIQTDCFQNVRSLVYIDWPENLRWIQDRAFQGCRGLTLTKKFNDMHLYQLGANAFNQSFHAIEDGMAAIKFRGCFRRIGSQAMTYLPLGEDAVEGAKWANLSVQFGAEGDPSLLIVNNPAGEVAFTQNGGYCIRDFTIYVDEDRWQVMNGMTVENSWYNWITLPTQNMFIYYIAGSYQPQSTNVVQA